MQSTLLFALIAAFAMSCGDTSLTAYDFTALTDLANGALVGENVGQPLQGFEIRLLQDGELLYHQAFGIGRSTHRPTSIARPKP